MLVCVGPDAIVIASEAMKFGMAANRVVHFPDAAAAKAIASRLIPGDLVLLKASGAIGLEVIAAAILSSRPQPLAAAS